MNCAHVFVLYENQPLDAERMKVVDLARTEMPGHAISVCLKCETLAINSVPRYGMNKVMRETLGATK